MYVATQHREDPNLFFVTPVDDTGNVDANNTFTVRADDASWWTQFDESTKQLIQQAINDATGVTTPGKDKPSAPESPSGMDAFNMQFNAYNPTGFKQSGGFGTQGAAWDSWSPTGFGASGGFGTQGQAWDNNSPTGWNSPGGWSLNPDAYSWGKYDAYGNPLTNAAYALSLSQGVIPQAAQMPVQQVAQQTSQLIDQNAQQKPKPGTLAYLDYIAGKPLSEW